MEYVGVGGKEFLKELSGIQDYKLLSLSEFDNYNNHHRNIDARALHMVYGINQYSVDITVALLERVSQLKNQPATKYSTLSVFKPRDNKFDGWNLDELVSLKHPGLPNLSLLTTANYSIIDGIDALSVYEGIKSDPPASLVEFVDLLSPANPRYRSSKKPINSKMPNPNMKSKLGR
jgi:hypothetical protein